MKDKIRLIISVLLFLYLTPVLSIRSQRIVELAQGQKSMPPQNSAVSNIDEVEVLNKLTSETQRLRSEIDSSVSSDRLKRLSESSQIQFKQLVNRSDVNARKLVALISGQSIPQLYAKDLLDNNNLIEQVRLAKRIGKLEFRKIEFVNSDLEVKVNDAAAQTGPQKARTIPVIITTYKGNVASGIYEVMWITKRGFDLKNKTPDTFPKPSDQKTGETTRDLPAGVYKMWTRSMTDQKSEGPKKDITVGGGQSECRDYLITKD